MILETTTIAAGVLLAIAFIFVLLRCYSRFILTKSFGVDDVCVIFGFLSAIALTYCLIRGRQFGIEKKDNQLNKLELAELIKSLWGGIICFCVGTTLVKSSAILQCLRFILLGKMRTFCNIFLAAIILLGAVSTLLTIFKCRPIQALWDFDVPGKTCIELRGYWYFACIGVVVTDIVVVVIPIISIKGLNMPSRQKLILNFVFGLGVFACTASVVRIYYLTAVGGSDNITSANAAASIWAHIELNIGIICVCTPPMKAIFTKLAPTMLTTTTRNTVTTSDLSGETLAAHRQHRSRKDTLVLIDETDEP